MTKGEVLCARQIKAARALLDWSQDDLARYSGLSVATIRKIEMGAISPRQSTMGLLLRAFEDAGLEFLPPDGVRHRPDEMKTYYGEDGRIAFFQEACDLTRACGGEILVVELPDASFLQAALGVQAMRDLWGNMAHPYPHLKCLLIEGQVDETLLLKADFRLLSRHFVNAMPFCVFGDYFAFIVASGSDMKIVAVRSSFAAAAARQQFLSLWTKAMPVVPLPGVRESVRAVA